MSSHDHAEHHVTPLKVYFGVYFALLFLTIVTVGVSYLGLTTRIIHYCCYGCGICKSIFGFRLVYAPRS